MIMITTAMMMVNGQVSESKYEYIHYNGMNGFLSPSQTHNILARKQQEPNSEKEEEALLFLSVVQLLLKQQKRKLVEYLLERMRKASSQARESNWRQGQ